MDVDIGEVLNKLVLKSYSSRQISGRLCGKLWNREKQNIGWETDAMPLFDTENRILI